MYSNDKTIVRMYEVMVSLMFSGMSQNVIESLKTRSYLLRVKVGSLVASFAQAFPQPYGREVRG